MTTGPTTTRHRTSSADAEATSQSLSTLYGGEVRVAGIDPVSFGMTADVAADDAMSIVRIHCASGEASAERLGDWVIAMCARGRMNWRVDGRAGSGHAPFLIRPTEPVHTTFSDIDVISVRIGTERMEAGAGIHGGRLPIGGAPRRDTRYLAAVLHQLDWMLRSTPDVFDSRIVMSSVRNAVAGAVVAGFGDAQGTAESMTASRSVRRALAFIEENLAEPITVAEIADAAGLSTRALEYAFRRHFGATPTQHVRRQRLARAHAELLRAEPHETTVRDIALAWGFAHHSRFARDYRAEYGRFPSETLRS